MTVTATGILSVPLARLRDIIAGSAAFQAFTGAADATAAAAFVHLVEAPRGSTTPYAIVDWLDFSRDCQTLGRAAFHQRQGSGLGAYFRAPVTNDDDDQAMLAFANDMGAIWSDIELGVSLKTLPIDSIELVNAPKRNVLEKRERQGDFFECELAFTYTRQP